MNSHVLREYDLIVQGQVSGWRGRQFFLNAEQFQSLTALIERETGKQDPTNLNPVATFMHEKGRPAMKLSQWVGLLRLADGTILEILPKTHQGGEDPKACREVLLRMLTATDERFKVAPPGELDPARKPLYEVFLSYALAGFRAALRRGVPHAYVTVEEERAGLRGKLNLNRQVRQLPSRSHLLHVTYDEYLPDRPETRLVRSSVERIARLTTMDHTRRLARETLQVLEGVPLSQNVEADFERWRLERGNAHFAPLKALARLILLDLNPLASGEKVQSLSVLFDMNKVYEAYVVWMLRRDHPDWVIRTQVKEKSLGTLHGNPVFNLKPDLHITLPDGEVVIADTKWKRLKNDPKKAFEVKQDDAYQMLAYSIKYQNPGGQLWLLYPRTPDGPPTDVTIQYPQDRSLVIRQVDL